MVIYLTHVKTVTETRAIWTYSFYKNFWDLLLVVGCEGPAIKTDIRLLLSPLTFSKILPYYYKYHTLILEQPALIWSLDEQSLPPGVELQATGTIPIGKFSGYGKKKTLTDLYCQNTWQVHHNTLASGKRCTKVNRNTRSMWRVWRLADEFWRVLAELCRHVRAHKKRCILVFIRVKC